MTDTKTKLKHPLDYPTVVGDKDGTWDLTTEFYSYDDGKVDSKAEKVEFTYEGSSGRLNVKAYYPGKAKDCDGWQLRLLDLRLEGVTFEYMEGRFIAGTGFVTDIGYFAEGQRPEIEGGRVESCFPPDQLGGKDSGVAVKIKFTLVLRKAKKS